MTNQYAVTVASTLWLFGLFAAPVLAGEITTNTNLQLDESAVVQADPAIAPLPNSPTNSIAAAISDHVSESSTLLTLEDAIAQTIHRSKQPTSPKSDAAEHAKDAEHAQKTASTAPKAATLIAQSLPVASQLPVPYPPKTTPGQTPPPAPPNPAGVPQFSPYGIPGQPYATPVAMPQGYPYGMVPGYGYGGMPMMQAGLPANAAPAPGGVNPAKLAPLPYPPFPGYAAMPGGYSYSPPPGAPATGYGGTPNGAVPTYAPSGSPYGVAPGYAPPGYVPPGYAAPSPYGVPPGNGYGVPYAAPLPPLPAPVGSGFYPGYQPGVVWLPPGYAYGAGYMAPTPGIAVPPGYAYGSGGAAPIAYPMGTAIAQPGAYPAPYPASPYPTSPYPGNPYPGNPYPASPYPGNPYPAPYPVPYPANAYPMGGMAPTAQMAPMPTNADPLGQPLPPLPAIPTPGTGVTQSQPLVRSTALNKPELQFQGVYIYQGSEGSGRARVTGTLPLTRNLLFGGTVDFVNGSAFTDSPNQGININELYLTASIPDLPNLRFVIGQLDLTSYFDRNSFAKDGARMFFNSVFQTNPALAATGIGSRQAALVNWSVNDYVEAKAAVFSSSKSLNDFSMDGFAGEIGLRFGNFIVRGTYATDRDGGHKDGFREIFQVDRGNGQTGVLRGDREEAFGVNAEIFFPEIKMGIFGRYGQYSNRAINRSATTYSAGVTFLDLFAKNDRLGIAYGQALSNSNLRRQSGNPSPDVFEVFYDFAVLPNLRLGVSYQALNGFSESILGVRLETDFNLIAPRR